MTESWKRYRNLLVFMFCGSVSAKYYICISGMGSVLLRYSGIFHIFSRISVCVCVFFLARMVSFFFRLSFIFISSSWFSFIFNLFFMYDYRILGARSLTCLVSLWFVEFQYINRYLLVTQMLCSEFFCTLPSHQWIRWPHSSVKFLLIMSCHFEFWDRFRTTCKIANLISNRFKYDYIIEFWLVNSLINLAWVRSSKETHHFRRHRRRRCRGFFSTGTKRNRGFW